MRSIQLSRRFSPVMKPTKKRFALMLASVVFVVIFVRSKLLCTDAETLAYVQSLCSSYVSGESVGYICHDLCRHQGFSSLSCHNHQQDKVAVFTGTWKNYNAIFKSVKRPGIELLPLYLNPPQHSRSEQIFTKMIAMTIKSRFNITVNSMDAKRMSYIKYIKRYNRYVEMKNIWSLLQDNEYVALVLYEKYGIFPKLLGSCGPVYAVQKLNTISGYWHLVTLYDTREEWIKRVNISIMILDFLVLLEKGLPDPLLICNMRVKHFGITDDFKKVLYLQPNSIYPLSVASRITGDGSSCKKHSDCDFLDCRSFCNLITYKCQHGVVNNNLQIVCEKIFLGWMLSGKVTVPGLLLGSRTPRVLTELLEMCANPASENDTPRASASKDIRKRLYNLLVYLKS